MTSEEKRLRSQIGSLLHTVDKDARKVILWELLSKSISGNSKAVNWLLAEFGNFIESEGKLLIKTSFVTPIRPKKKKTKKPVR